MIDNTFCFIPLPTLLQLQTQYTAALSAIAIAGQSYSVAGKSFTKADLKNVAEILGSIAYAIAVQQGNIQRFVYADMSGGA